MINYRRTISAILFILVLCICSIGISESLSDNTENKSITSLYHFSPTIMEPDLKENQYSYMRDGFNLYIATQVDDNTLKIERWTRSDRSANGDAFKYNYDVLSVNTNNASWFTWFDDSHSAFRIIMKDGNNYRWENDEAVSFSRESDKSSHPQYTFMHDKWYVYRAFYLSESLIKIEGWRRSDAGKNSDPFRHDRDVIVIDLNKKVGINHDLTWLDDDHAAFMINMIDIKNAEWKEISTAWFTINPSNDSPVYICETGRDIFKAYPLTPSVMKIECWESYDNGDDSYAYRKVRDCAPGSPKLSPFKIHWNNDEHTSCTIFENTFTLDLSETVTLFPDESAVSDVTTPSPDIETDEQAIQQGTYAIGSDIEPGSYIIQLRNVDYYSPVAVFTDKEKLSDYLSWSSYDLAKFIFHAQENGPFHITLNKGEYLYIPEGYGTLKAAEKSELLAGIYTIGEDFPAGTYEITMSGMYEESIIVVFENASKLTSYFASGSMSERATICKQKLYVEDNTPFSLTLEDGDVLFIERGKADYK